MEAKTVKMVSVEADQDLWAEFKACASLRRLFLKEALEAALRLWISTDYDPEGAQE